MPEPRVSVVVTAYNCADFIGDALDSVLAQTRPVDEIVVVDDGSCDDTKAVVRRYDGVRVVSQSNQGASAARNRGIAATSGDFVSFLDCDDIWLPEKTRQQVHYLRDDPTALMVSGGKIWWDSLSDERWVFDYSARDRAAPHRSLPFVNCVGNPSMVMIRREALDHVGGFDTRWRWGQDWELWMRIAQIGRIGFVPEPVIVYRWHPANLSHDRAREARLRSHHRVSLHGIASMLPVWRRPGARARAWSTLQLQHAELANERGDGARHLLYAVASLLAFPFDHFAEKAVRIGRAVVGESRYQRMRKSLPFSAR